MGGGNWFSKQENSITPKSAVAKGYITGKRSNEVKIKVLNAYGSVIRERLLHNTPYSIVYENNGKKTRNIYNIAVKRVLRKNPTAIFCFNNFDVNAMADKPTLKLRMDVPRSSVRLKIRGRELREALKAIPYSERYKFPKE